MSDSEDENYATFGIPLEPLDEENLPRKKAVTVEDQYAYDAQGRRRFHGAFTGGFSAGYFNTVGTRDGWKPQQFKSSRGSKAKTIEQQPEDFMDEEDVSIFGIAPKGIRANSDYEYHGQKGIKRGRTEIINNRSLSYNPVLKELLRPVRETVGIALLKKMGWKPGQGIGNRITKKEKIKAKQQIERIKVYGCSLPKNEEKEIDSNIDSDDETPNITFAPDDYEPFKSKGKDNYFGIGYSGLNRQNILSNQINEEYNYQSNNKTLPIFGHAFGVGAFEADDEDIYEREDMSRYDSVLGPERKSKTRWSKDNISNDNGSNCIEGFVQAKDKLNYRKTFALPCLPKNYCAIHITRKSRFFPPIPHQSINEKKKSLNVIKRAKILQDINFTDTAIQGKLDTTTKTLNSTISMPVDNSLSEPLNSSENQKAKNSEKVVEKPKTQVNSMWVGKLNTKTFVSGGVTGTEQITSGLLNIPTHLNSSSSFANVESVNNQIYKSPVLTDQNKQERFEQTLTCLKTNDNHKSDNIQSLSAIKSDKDLDLVEFKKATKSIEQESSNDNDINNSNKYIINITDSLEKQKDEAAKMEMFGKLTREITEWQPAGIVCKRFNIPEPRNSCIQTKIEKKPRFSVFNSLDLDVSSRFLKVTDTIGKDIDNKASTSYKDEFIKDYALPSSTYYKTSVENQEPEIMSEKMKNFEASYEKIFGKTVHEVPSTKLLTCNTEQEFLNEESNMLNIEQHQILADIEKSQHEETSITHKKNSEEKKDLFRAIFLSSSEESETEIEENIDNEVVKSVLIGDSSNDVNISRNMSPPRGIFAKLDLEDLVKKTHVSTEDIESNIKEKGTSLQLEPQTIIEQNYEINTCDTLQMPLPEKVYGPMLPSRLIKDGNILTDSTGSTEFSRPICKSVIVPKVVEDFQGKWVELHKTKKSKKVKKKHKHKEHKSSKSKRKSKKHKR
ncbi:G patch domain-containing protein 1 homolog isoform X1 [Vespa velutina]|uniref:G patch domain-containing protein 1 homolog isoform X1 n=2 Tax=Vespa velutina TaxID=202808 RepID=UPI001FB27DCB|nr:G patch domain-containing protein 1 homolog isoform X1 [Vespa velutina]